MPLKPTLANDFLNDAEVAAILRVSPWTVRRWRAKGIGPRFCRLVGKIFYFSSDIEEYIRSLPTGGGVSPRQGAG
jgi:predicted site-specific integrase-resolvase